MLVFPAENTTGTIYSSPTQNSFNCPPSNPAMRETPLGGLKAGWPDMAGDYALYAASVANSTTNEAGNNGFGDWMKDFKGDSVTFNYNVPPEPKIDPLKLNSWVIDDPIEAMRRFWGYYGKLAAMLAGMGGGGLPNMTGAQQYMVLQINPANTPIWDWVRAHP